jgi:hypothetical protein
MYVLLINPKISSPLFQFFHAVRWSLILTTRYEHLLAPPLSRVISTAYFVTCFKVRRIVTHTHTHARTHTRTRTHTHREHEAAVGLGTAPQDRKCRVRLPVGSWENFKWPNPSVRIQELEVHSVSNRNEYQRISLCLKCGWRVELTTLPSKLCRTSKQASSLH